VRSWARRRAAGQEAFQALVATWSGWRGEALARASPAVAAAAAQRLVREGRARRSPRSRRPEDVAAAPQPSAAWLRNVVAAFAPGDAAAGDAARRRARAAAEALPWPECVAMVDANHGS
jgi:hypothetical protein